MVAVGVLGAWAGYAVLTWGYILVRGWDVPFSQWVSPLNPYTWPAPPAAPPYIPDTQLTPSAASAGAPATTTSSGGVPGGGKPKGKGGGKKAGGGGGGNHPHN